MCKFLARNRTRSVWRSCTRNLHQKFDAGFFTTFLHVCHRLKLGGELTSIEWLRVVQVDLRQVKWREGQEQHLIIHTAANVSCVALCRQFLVTVFSNLVLGQLSHCSDSVLFYWKTLVTSRYSKRSLFRKCDLASRSNANPKPWFWLALTLKLTFILTETR